MTELGRFEVLASRNGLSKASLGYSLCATNKQPGINQCRAADVVNRQNGDGQSSADFISI